MSDADVAIEWEVEVDYAVEGTPLGDFAARFRTAVAEHPDVRRARGDADAGACRVAVEIRVIARAPAEAERLAESILFASMDAAASACAPGPPQAFYAGVGTARRVR